MDLAIEIVKEAYKALTQRHYITAGELSRAAYLIAMVKTHDGRFINDIAEIDRFCLLQKYGYAEDICRIVISKYGYEIV